VFESMKVEGVHPTAVTYGCMMNGCDAAGRGDDAFKLYQEACAHGIVPSDELHNILINIFAKNNR
jgi:pentatricopeptide repeat protein